MEVYYSMHTTSAGGTHEISNVFGTIGFRLAYVGDAS